MAKRARRKRNTQESYPMPTAAKIESAINLRHHGKGKSLTAPAVLRKAARAIGRVSMSATRRKELRAKLERARAVDRRRKTRRRK